MGEIALVWEKGAGVGGRETEERRKWGGEKREGKGMRGEDEETWRKGNLEENLERERREVGENEKRGREKKRKNGDEREGK